MGFFIVLDPLAGLQPWLQPLVAGGVLVAVECLLLFLLVRGILPGFYGQLVVGFPERQLAIGITVLSLISWLVYGGSLGGDAVRFVLNGALVFCTLVYFVAKSILSRRVRWGVLAVLVLPAAQFYFAVGSRDV